jgi:hypothetical protein
LQTLKNNLNYFLPSNKKYHGSKKEKSSKEEESF